MQEEVPHNAGFCHGCVYTHTRDGGDVGVIVEVGFEKLETRQADQFKALCQDLCEQIIATRPLAVSRGGLNPDEVERQRALFAKCVQRSVSSPGDFDGMAEKHLEPWLAGACLLEQEFIKRRGIKVADWLQEVGDLLGDTLTVRRFTRYKAGEVHETT